LNPWPEADAHAKKPALLQGAAGEQGDHHSLKKWQCHSLFFVSARTNKRHHHQYTTQ
jgi:hypothetical protein